MGWRVTNPGVQTQIIGPSRTVESGWNITVITDTGQEITVPVTDAEYANPDTVRARINAVVATAAQYHGMTG